MITVNVFDNLFPGQPSVVFGKTPHTMQYVRNQMEWDGITIFTGGHIGSPIVDEVKSRYKIGWLIEGECLRPEEYQWAWNARHKLDCLLTSSMKMVIEDLAGKCRYCIKGGIWTPREQWGMHPKSRNVSMILSEKRGLEGHAFRHMIAESGFNIDLYGPGYTPIGHDKAIAYKDYRYAVVVEACYEWGFFTEHILDAMVFGCIPIYRGHPGINDLLKLDLSNRERGILTFNHFGDLGAILSTCSEQHYESLRPYAEYNFERLGEYEITEDWMLAHPLKSFVEALV